MNAEVETGINIDYASRRRPEAAPRSSRIDIDGIVSSIRGFAGVSESLRMLGAAVLVASMSMFLLQGWDEGNDVRRYLMLLTQTGLLAGAGFTLSHWLKEAKGARVFFGLALVSISANFTVLGALIYSVLQWDSGLTTYPDFAAWQVESAANIGITLAGALVVLVPVTLFGFAVMARHSAKALSLNFLAMNLLLLLPIRNSVAAGTVALMSVFYALYLVKSSMQKDRALKTPEGRFALTTLFIPAGIILFRSLYLYQIDSLMIVMLTLAAFLAARQAAVSPDRSVRVSRVLDVLSLPVALVFGLAVADTVTLANAWGLTAPLCVVAYSALALDVMRRTDSRLLAGLIALTVSLAVSVSFVLTVAAQQTALTAILCLVAGAILLLAGVTARNLTASIAGAATIVGGATLGFDPIVALLAGSSWVDLAIFGAIAIISGSALDRHGVAIRLRLENWFGSVNRRGAEVAQDD